MMSFLKILQNPSESCSDIVTTKPQNITVGDKILLESENPEDILRKAGFKIKLITPTSFGTQIDFAKQYEEKDIETVLKDFQIKIKNKSVFIIE